ncbi:wiskott-Aldrich syndrome protein family member 2-like [Helianthus annuus]|uniref:wiskott-Aldrich syndrome protein family member 2-like n=1 Tax=Helianthus annuus TaxID=4232 RepID=UPI000B8F664E|nr:wiskott-Aldrich syndrome protein family member 2-like [Helianthus annuus]
MKEMMKQVLEASKSQHSHQQISQELWNSVQPILAAQRELAELQHISHMELIRVMVEARYKDTQADKRGIKESLSKLSGTSPAPVFEKDDQDDAKKGEKNSMRKLDVNPKANLKDEEIVAKQKRKDTAESKADVWKKEQEDKMKRENQTKNIGTSNRRKSFRNNRPPIDTFTKTNAASKKPQTTASTKLKPSPQKPPQKKQKTASKPPSSPPKSTDVDASKASVDVKATVVETTVVSTVVSQSTTSIHFDPPSSTQPPTPQIFPLQSTFSPKPPSPSKTPPPPKFAYARKRKFVVLEEEKEIPSPMPLSSAPVQIIPPSSSPQTNPLNHPPLVTCHQSEHWQLNILWNCL